MSKQVELEKLDRAIKDANIRSGTVKMTIEVLDREIGTLDRAEIAFEENIKFLKQEKIVTMADKFKEAREELKRIRIRLITLKNERADYTKALDNVNQVIQQSLEAIEKIKRNGDNNVLLGKFGKADG